MKSTRWTRKDYCSSIFINTPLLYLLGLISTGSFRDLFSSLLWLNFSSSIYSPTSPRITVLRTVVSIFAFIIRDYCSEISKMTWSFRSWGRNLNPFRTSLIWVDWTWETVFRTLKSSVVVKGTCWPIKIVADFPFRVVTTYLKMWECFLFILKEKYYPFKSHLDRDKIFQWLVRPRSPTWNCQLLLLNDWAIADNIYKNLNCWRTWLLSLK